MQDSSQFSLFTDFPDPPMPAPRSKSLPAAVIVLPLHRNRQLVAALVGQFLETAPGPDRASRFRRDVLVPLADARKHLGVRGTQIETEVVGLEEAMVGVLDRHHRMEASA